MNTTIKQRRILILKFPYSSTFGGGEKHTLTLVEKLTRHTFYLLSTCSVLVPEFQKRNWHVQTIWAGTEPVTLKTLLLFFITAPFIAINLLRYLVVYRWKYKIDTLFCLSLTEKILLTPWARLLGMQVIWMEHLQIEHWLLKSPLRFLYVLWSHFATVVTVVKAVKQQLQNIGVPKNTIEVIYNAVNLSEYSPTPSNPQIVTEHFKILFIGRLATEKGVADLLTAVSIIKQAIPKYTVTIVGQGDEEHNLRNQATELGIDKNVEFVGFQTKIQSWLQQCDVLVLPATRRETFGIVLAEALATEKPVIATTVGGLAEVVDNHGWLVPPHDPAALAAALQDVYMHYPAALNKAHQGRKRVLQLFSEPTMLQHYDSLFSKTHY